MTWGEIQSPGGFWMVCCTLTRVGEPLGPWA